jgi:hypothetical protein
MSTRCLRKGRPLSWSKRYPNTQADQLVVMGGIICNIPMIDNVEGNPLKLIKTGDFVEVDADRGIVTVKSESNRNEV